MAFVWISYGFRKAFRKAFVRPSYGFRTAFVRRSLGVRWAFVRRSCGVSKAFVRLLESSSEIIHWNIENQFKIYFQKSKKKNKTPKITHNYGLNANDSVFFFLYLNYY